MLLHDTLSMALRGLSTHKSRSFLTILGIVIGISSITLVTSIGQSAEGLILGEVQGLGAQNVFVIPGREPSGPNGFGFTILDDSLKERDLEALRKKSNVPDATRVVPFVFGPAVASYGSEAFTATVLGGTDALVPLYNLDLSAGMMFDDYDVRERSQIAVIGKDVAKELFGSSTAIGEKIKLKDSSVRVIGVLGDKGQSPFVDFDDAIVMPYTTAQTYILGFSYIQRIAVTASSPETMDAVVKDIEATLRDMHNITDPEKDDFFVQTPTEIADTFSTITSVLTLLLASVAGISLVVGGVGIMNIMLVSVTERTREIGLRKALGAKNNDILLQFLTEAVILTVAGGILGIAIGLSLSYFAAFAARTFAGIAMPFILPVSGMVMGVLVSAGIGLIFGLFPARQAALKSPMEALRYE
ncbi:MAG: ABC transporter permease [Patescibacteria group bacterium]